MTQLAHLHWRLRRLWWGRRLFRWGAAWSATLAVALAAVLTIFAADVAFEAGPAARVVLLVLGAATALTAFWKLALPWLFVRENLLDMALLVERRTGHAGRSDLPAALQFELPGAIQWGSPQLEAAVIQRVSQEARRLDVFAGASLRPLVRRVAMFLTAAAAAGAVALAWPEHVAVFFRRMALGNEHYPSRTALHAVQVNGHVVLESPTRHWAPAPVRCAEGQPLWIAVAARGRLPEKGEVEVVSRSTRQRRKLPLERLGEKKPADESVAGPLRAAQQALSEYGNDREGAIYVATLERLMEPLAYQIFLGDAWTDPGEIVLVALPAIETKISVTAPDYAGSAESAGAVPPGARQLSVLEGSRLDFQATSTNGKPLVEAVLAVTRGGATQRVPLQPADDARLVWRLEGDRHPLSQIAEELRFALEVRDEDGLSPAAPTTGVVRIRPDRPPRVAARTVTRVVLPNAAPAINLDLADDYGVHRPAVELKITRSNGSQESRTLNDLAFQRYNEEGRFIGDTVAFPLTGAALPWRGGCRVNLAPLQLEKGDRVTAVVVVTDYRGPTASPAAQAASQPLEFEVSDEAGVYRAALEADKQALEDITQAADLQQELLRAAP